jgi:hypothetical protein
MRKTSFVLAFSSLFLLAGCGQKQQQKVSEPDTLQVSDTVNISAPIPIDSLHLDIIRVANMLIAEKASGKIDNAPFVAYLDSLGFKKAEVDRHHWPISSRRLKDLEYELRYSNGEIECYEIEVSGSFLSGHSPNEGKENSIMKVMLVTEEANHIFAIDIKDNNFCWSNLIQLKHFGIDGPDAIGKGKGLITEAGGDFFLIRFDTAND